MKTQQQIRLNDNYRKTIKLLAKKYFDTDDVRIFGSRTDLNKKGGDIDLYIKTNKKNNILKSKITFLREFEMKLGEQRVDLIIHAGKDDKKIFEIARNEGVRI